MGEIYKLNVKDFQKQHNLKYFVETGTGLGESLERIYRLGVFDKLFSCEINKQIFDRITLDNDQCMIYRANSIDFFKIILPNLDSSCLFWLDAHFPGADFGYANYNDNVDYNLKFPLESEIKFLCENRDISQDVIIIDDWQLYEKLDWGNKRAYDKSIYDFGIDIPLDGSGIINALFKTHNLNYDLRDQGFLICTPI